MVTDDILQVFGLEVLLTEADDPALWAAALRQYWPRPNDPKCMVEALRFEIGRRLTDGEQPQGEDNERDAVMRGMVEIQKWRFERVDEDHLQPEPCPTGETPPVILPGLNLMVMMSGMTSGTMPGPPPIPLPTQVIFISLGISRPSQELGEAVVFSGFTAPGVGEGNAYLWRRAENSQWVMTDQRVAWWLT